MLDELQHLVGVAHLVVVPGNDLHKGVGQLDASLGVENGGALVAQEVGRNNVLVGVAEHALQAAFFEGLLGSRLHRSADILILRGLREVAGQVDNRNVQGRYAHGHAGQLAVELGVYLADSLSRPDTLNVILADMYGHWRGSGTGPSLQVVDTIATGIPLHLGQRIQVRHIMRLDTIEGIEQVGITFLPRLNVVFKEAGKMAHPG